MITNKKIGAWHYLGVKCIMALLRGMTSKIMGIFIA